MEPRLKIASLVISVCLLAFVLELVRRKRLKERYSLLWLAMSVTLIVLIAWPRAAVALRDLLGMVAISNAIFLAAVLFIVLLCIHFSVRLSALSEEMRKAAQEIALLKAHSAKRREP